MFSTIKTNLHENVLVQSTQIINRIHNDLIKLFSTLQRETDLIYNLITATTVKN